MPKRQSFMVRIHLPINGKYYLWYEVDEERNVKWYLPRDEAEAQEAVIFTQTIQSTLKICKY